MSELARAPTPAAANSGERIKYVGPSSAVFVIVGIALSAFVVLLNRVTAAPPEAVPARALLAPLIVLVGLTGFAILCTALVRNLSVMLGVASIQYYRTYSQDQPPEWLERPARVYNNLLEAPQLFYVLCALLLALGEADRTQLRLAWIYVGLRCAHAVIYAGWNHVPTRFACFAASMFTLTVLWYRFASAYWPGLG